MTVLKRKQMGRVKKAFRSFSGPDLLIDYAEWKKALGIENDFLAERIFHLVDQDGTGYIDLGEFLAFAERLYSDDRRKRLEFVFRIYDVDGDGAIEKGEIRKILDASLREQNISLNDDVVARLVESFMCKIDAEESGRISVDQFVSVIGGYPGIDEQFSIYAAEWLNVGKGFKLTRIRTAGLFRRLKHVWRTTRRGWFWGPLYLAGVGALTWDTARTYADAGLALQVARAAGACLYLNLALILLPMCRSFWTWAQHTPLDRLFPIDNMTAVHRFLGYSTGVFALTHVGGHVAHYIASGQSIPGILFHTSVGLTGVVTTAALGFMVWSSRKPSSRRYEIFAFAHFIYAGFLVALLLHAAWLWMWLAIPLLLYLADAAVRLSRKTRPIEITEMKPFANGVTRVHFKKPDGFEFYPGDYLKFNVHALSPLQWHPFTISAAPEAATIGVHVRNNGDWTGALHNFSRNIALESKDWVAHIDGPYSAPSSRIYRSKIAVLIATGIGVTPFASVLQSIVLRYSRSHAEPAKPDQIIYFHWLNRDHQSYEWFTDLLSEAEHVLGSDYFKLHVHLTSMTHDLTNIAMQIAMDAYHHRHESDPITGLAAETSAGFPEWDSVFAAVSEAHPDERVDVFFCGPPALGSVVRKKCSKHGLLYHEENFSGR